MVKGDRDVYKRLTAQINADYDLKKWLQVGTNNSIENWSTKSVSQMSQYGSVMNSVMTLDPPDSCLLCFAGRVRSKHETGL